MKEVTEFTNNLLDGSIKQDEINTFIGKLKNNELDSELQEIKEMIEDQLSYVHPLKMKTQAKMRKTGKHNQKVLDALNNIKTSDDVNQALSALKAIFA
ncbi:MAG: hypothetical protein GAK29_02170 [Acinetobacter bereziniae]|uniref:Uncharacterized protein n=1 Tax=Acinetobacter bereziniae TaxID=106648 RepID=A0A833UP61_ACIBZ|nr:MAG: hypothetical protein GAK29_02170 [Acinetobacter bereziniae]